MEIEFRVIFHRRNPLFADLANALSVLGRPQDLFLAVDRSPFRSLKKPYRLSRSRSVRLRLEEVAIVPTAKGLLPGGFQNLVLRGMLFPSGDGVGVHGSVVYNPGTRTGLATL
ncbi:MAG: hypothetical protein UT86_C0001G0078 [Candidatus Magasanikbacteria bacterium GW2011_GWC2_40_17]|uniref:Uncharacterized protein n=1 Tax=Candidatus Magasanikbacteria bacterium GW2011_GWA2_42_32 TaxID=1619039 RepID=A0A0G1D5V3_9BACT|nr:MAG: hypothetical protein UT86_C0001G0078 [Candidatus Magasanikbacteria bacterium GW2011_GWC2_40_17]KKS57438.1 MAG: hypothetical protein UV20_C0001G0078 [Candidatus Magasanikbacteria bacterium GW2011_GWA2_42_32]OGH85570.1 MAG: hypothetical protein A2294_01670 [Candidatus Magasanikbacteria bacterium RIFOXYB2_FULL_38_10]